MRILLAGIETPLAKIFIKNYKAKHGMVALDPTKADFSRLEPIKDVFNSYRFDAVIYFASSISKELSLFKNLQYACILQGITRLVTVFEYNDKLDSESAFDCIVPDLIEKDKISVGLKFYNIYGKGEKNSIVAKQIAAAKKGKIDMPKDRLIPMTYVEDAAMVLYLALESDLLKGNYDIANPKPEKLSAIASGIKKHLPDIKVCVKDKVAEECEFLQSMNLDKFTQEVPKFKFTTLANSIKGMLETSQPNAKK